MNDRPFSTSRLTYEMMVDCMIVCKRSRLAKCMTWTFIWPMKIPRRIRVLLLTLECVRGTSARPRLTYEMMVDCSVPIDNPEYTDWKRVCVWRPSMPAKAASPSRRVGLDWGRWIRCRLYVWGGWEMVRIRWRTSDSNTNRRNKGWTSADRSTEATLMLTVPRSILKSSTMDLT